MNDLGLEFVATERYNERPYGLREVSYYIKPGIIEIREKDRNGHFVKRYLVTDETALSPIVDMIKMLALTERKTARGHNDLFRLLNLHPMIFTVIVGDVDSPERSIRTTGGVNLPDAIKDAGDAARKALFD